MSDPWTDRLSEYLDGELSADECRELWRHLSACEICPRVLEDLRAIVAEARSLPDRAPERDLWPDVAARAGVSEVPLTGSEPTGSTRVWLTALVAAAAGILLTLGAQRFATSDVPTAGPGEEVASLPRWLLLLREPPEMMADATPEQVSSVVAEYASWAEGLAIEQHLLGAEKLAEDRGWMHRPDDGAATPFAPLEEATGAPERVGGFFLIQAADVEEANEIASECPHLGQGGWVELRRIEEL